MKRGQHFLKDKRFIIKIINSALLDKKDIVLEIGCGYGNLTYEIAKRVKKIYAIEIDNELIEKAKEKLKKFNNVILVEGDILLYKIPKEVNKIVTNPPFEITSFLIDLFIKFLCNQGDLVVTTLQKEIFDKLIAKPGDRNFSSLSILCEKYVTIDYLGRIPRRAFSPPPKVDVVLLRMKPKTKKWEPLFNFFVRLLFMKRNRKIKYIIKHWNLSLNIPQEIENKKCFMLNLDEINYLYEQWLRSGKLS